MVVAAVAVAAVATHAAEKGVEVLEPGTDIGAYRIDNPDPWLGIVQVVDSLLGVSQPQPQP